jgi:DNA-directed RNA polymerase specialized sigma24 family protein
VSIESHACARTGQQLAEELALVSASERRRLLAVHRRRLRWQDLEDCYSQATLELLDQARRGTLHCSSRGHLRNILEQRFLSRVHDRRRALAGRSPAQAMLDGALSLGAPGERQLDIADDRADVERRALLRFELRSLERAAYVLSTDQRLVLCCQIMQMSRRDFCSTFGWSHEKYRKVAQRGRSRLRRELSALGSAGRSEGRSEGRSVAGAEGPSVAGSRGPCPTGFGASEKAAGTTYEAISPHP